MNDLKFLNHPILFSLDPNLMISDLYPEYMSIYKNFPNPPGVEYFLSRTSKIQIKCPWNFENTEYPLPAVPNISDKFSDIADEFGKTITTEIDQGKQVYIMWSGGIDSTAVAISVLKNLQNYQHQNVSVVCSEMSRRENPMFWHNFLSNFQQIELASFDPAVLDIKNIVILDGEGGDQIFGSSAANRIFSLNPEKIHLPWRSHIDFLKQNLTVSNNDIKKYWPDQDWATNAENNNNFFDFFLDLMQQSIDSGPAQVETLFDFYWWINFNFKFDSVMWRHTLRLGHNISDFDFEFFSKNTVQRLFAQDKMQQWSMSCGAENKIQHAKKTIKWAARNYIYDFDQNEYYFREKRKEYSTETIATTTAKYIAIDKNYKRYSVADRSTRQSLKKTFYPNTKNMVKIPESKLWQT